MYKKYTFEKKLSVYEGGKNIPSIVFQREVRVAVTLVST